MREIALVLVAASSALAPGQTIAPLTSKVPVIEHAEIILGADGSEDQAFLTIWNGMSEEKSISDVRINGYSQIKLVQAGRVPAERYTTDVDDMALAIPSNSEVYMNPNTVFFSIKRLAEPGGTVEVELEIDNRYTIKSIAAVKASGSSVTSHHHGEAQDR